MDTITRRLKQSDGVFREQTFHIYSREEADAEGIDYKEDWRDCKPGDYGLTDDGYVLLCRALSEMAALWKNKNSGKRKRKEHIRKRYYKFAVGEPIITHNRNTGHTNKVKFAYLPYKQKGGYSHASAKTWSEHAKSRKRVQQAMELYAEFHIEDEGKISWDKMVQVGALYRADSKWPVLDFKKFLRTKEGRDLFMEKLKEALVKADITYQNTLERMEETYEQAKEHNHTQVMRGVYKDQLDLIKEADGHSAIQDDTGDFDFTYLESRVEESIQLPEITPVEVLG